MKNLKILITAEILLSLIAGYLVSKMSWIGRLGINLAYKEYSVFKSWWKTAILFAAIQLVLVLAQYFITKKRPKTAKIGSFALLIIALVGLYATYNDFNSTFSHKLLKEKFHLGFYLFWISWILGNAYFLTTKASVVVQENQNIQ